MLNRYYDNWIMVYYRNNIETKQMIGHIFS